MTTVKNRYDATHQYYLDETNWLYSQHHENAQFSSELFHVQKGLLSRPQRCHGIQTTGETPEEESEEIDQCRSEMPKKPKKGEPTNNLILLK